MVKIYHRYLSRGCFGLVNSSPSNVIFDSSGKCAITGALEQIIIRELDVEYHKVFFKKKVEKNNPLLQNFV